MVLERRTPLNSWLVLLDADNGILVYPRCGRTLESNHEEFCDWPVCSVASSDWSVCNMNSSDWSVCSRLAMSLFSYQSSWYVLLFIVI